MTTAVSSAHGFPAWLETLLSLLPQSKASVRVPDPPEEFVPLVEMGRNALGARDVADLRARLDGDILRLRELPLPKDSAFDPKATDTLLNELPEEAPEDSIIAVSLGLNVAGKLLRAMHELGAVLKVFTHLVQDTRSHKCTLAMRALMVRPWSLHDGHVVPHALVESAIVQARGLIALGALLAACVDARRPEPWLTNALGDALLGAVRELSRLLASAGYDAGLRRTDNLLDLEALFREAEEADAALMAALEQDLQQGRFGIPEDE